MSADNKIENAEIIDKDTLALMKLLGGGKLTVDSAISDIEHSDAVLFHDQNDETYIAFNGNGSSVAPIDSKISKMWLNKRCYEQYRKVLPSSGMKQVLDTLSAKAYFDGNQHKLNVRHAWVDDELWYDLGSSAVSINKDMWTETDTPPIIFKRFSHQIPQVSPKSGGDVRLLLKYVNITNPQEQLLFLVYVISAFIPDFDHPLLVFSGPQGAGKTTPMRVIKALIDPSLVSGTTIPKDVTAFVQAASHDAFIFFDNLSEMPEWFSDALARASTGDSFTKRKLYTDNDDVIYYIQKAIALNGLTQVVTKGDLLDRAILLNLERITPDKRKTKEEFWREFEHDRNIILGAIFDVLSKAMKLQPSIKLSRLPRMADFTIWSYAIAEAAGFSGMDFITAYNENIKVQHDEAINANPLAVAIVQFMQDRDEWRGTASQLYGPLEAIVKGLYLAYKSGWPANAAILGKELRKLIPNLKDRGIIVTIPPRGNERTITITKITDVTDSTDGRIG